MYCSNCGSELLKDANACTTCGTMAEGRVARISVGGGERASIEGCAQSDPRAGRTDSYEYTRTTVKSDLATVTTDCYESLGFELTGAKESPASGTTALAFRRSRKVRAKAQLSKLQRTMDDLLKSIASMEAEKTSKARTQAIAFGTVSALVLGLGMCCTMVWTHLFVIGIIIGIIGIGGCLLTFLNYRKTVASETARIDPRIENAYDQLATACEEAQTVLREPEAR